MSKNWDSKETKAVPVLTEQMLKEAQWWADNRYASVKDRYPVDKTVPFKKMTKSGLDNLIKSMTKTPESVDAEIKRVTESLKGVAFTDEMLAEIKKSMLSKDAEVLAEETRKNAIQRYKNTVFDKFKIELNYGKSEYVTNDMWLAYLHYSKEQHELKKQCKGDEESKELRDHIRQHGQLVKNG